MKTIKTKLFLIFSGCMLAFVLGSMMLNSLFLERYYVFKNKGIFVATSDQIVAAYNDSRVDIVELLRRIDRVDGMSCTIADRNMVVKLSSYPQNAKSGASQLPSEIEQLVRGNQLSLPASYIYSQVESPDYQVREMAYITKLSDDGLLVLKKPIKSIVESSEIANQFFLFTGMFLVCIGSLVISFFSKKITSPVIAMSKVTASIADLDFTQQVTYHADDEIGSLGRSINLISEKLSASISSLQQDVDRRKLLVRNISHELKTPIGVIKGYAEGLKYGVASDREKAQRYCTVIAAECDRMDEMIRELLHLSLLESGAFKANLMPLDPCQLVNNVAERFTQAMQARAIHLVVQCASNLSVDADTQLLERAISNYLINALNHVHDQGRIEIRVDKDDIGVIFSVFNTGPHISQSDLNNIWDVFFKANKARSRQYGGNGLGLSIVKQIVELHGGSCGVENVPGGVRFYLKIV